jgi:hypothetical protein
MLNFELAKNKIANSIEGTIIYYYGERAWNRMSLKERYNIIEDIVRDNSSYWGLSEKEINKIIKIEQSKEG